ncbi:MAG: helicase, partial [Chryseobacterium gambrini]|nr:helicase [Chryseobacterium gambrini]
KKGIVIHHGSLPLKIRSILEKYTNEGLCRICFATSTLEQGVNMPFDIVYLNRLDGSKPLSVKNLIGRAGRSTLDYKFDYGFVIVQANNLSSFRNIMLHDEILEEVSLLDIVEEGKDLEYIEFKDAILNDTFSDEYNLTENQINKLITEDVFVVITQLLNLIFTNNEIIPLSVVNNDVTNRLLIYEKFQKIYSIYLERDLVKAEEYILNTAIKIILWRIHGKTFKKICWYRYSYASQSNIRNKYKRIPDFISGLQARYFTEFSEIPNKNLFAYNALENILAKDVDYDYIVSDTYDFIDKLIGFKLSDVFFAAFIKFFEKTSDIRALRLGKFIKYGTDSDRHILMLRYGLTFEDIEILDSYIKHISTEEIIFDENVFNLEDKFLEPIKRYI